MRQQDRLGIILERLNEAELGGRRRARRAPRGIAGLGTPRPPPAREPAAADPHPRRRGGLRASSTSCRCATAAASATTRSGRSPVRRAACSGDVVLGRPQRRLDDHRGGSGAGVALGPAGGDQRAEHRRPSSRSARTSSSWSAAGARAAESYELVGPLAELTLANINVDVAIIGVDGVNATAGLTTHHEVEAQTNRSLLRAAERVIVVADSSKIGRRGFARISEIGAATDLVTDAGVGRSRRRRPRARRARPCTWSTPDRPDARSDQGVGAPRRSRSGAGSRSPCAATIASASSQIWSHGEASPRCWDRPSGRAGRGRGAPRSRPARSGRRPTGTSG